MDIQEIRNHMLSILSEDEVMFNEPMSNHTSFRIGGPADVFVIPKSRDKLLSVLELCKKLNIPYYVIGNGSNLLVRDGGFRGVIIQILKELSDVKITDTKVYAEAGILLSKLSKIICEAGLEGFEFAAGIPGTLGGAVYMNAGAYDGEMKQIVESVEAIDSKGQIVTLLPDELEFGYRTSAIAKKGYIVLSATLQLAYGDKEKIREKIEHLNYLRKSKQPLEMPSAGSTFKRPEGYFAGKLIMDSGLRGYSIGDAQVSEKHCGFVVNKGNATCKDVLALIKHIQDTVRDNAGIELEPEVRIIGEDSN